MDPAIQLRRCGRPTGESSLAQGTDHGNRRLIGLVVAATIAIAPIVPGTAAHAAAPASPAGQTAIQRDISSHLDRVPGGVQIGSNQIAWEDGAVVMTVLEPGTTQAAAGKPVWSRLGVYLL